MQETQVRFPGWEDPLEKEMAIHSSTLAWKITWMEEPDRLQSMGSQRVGHNWATSLSLSNTIQMLNQRFLSSTQTCTSLFLSNCLLDICTWMSNWYHQLKIPQMEFLIYPPCPTTTITTNSPWATKPVLSRDCPISMNKNSIILAIHPHSSLTYTSMSRLRNPLALLQKIHEGLPWWSSG